MKLEKENEFKEILARMEAKDEGFKEVDFKDFELNSDDAQFLARALQNSKVTSLDLSNNNIGDAGVAAFSEVLAQSQVTNLVLSLNKISDAGAAALAKVLAQSQVISLDLGGNYIGAEGAVALAEVLAQSQVTSLNLALNSIGHEGTAALAKVLAQSRVTNLNLSMCYHGDGVDAVISQALAQSKVTSLDLSGKDIRDEGAAALANVLTQIQVTSLNLRSTHLKASGTEALAKGLAQSHITNLDLSVNFLGDAGAAALAKGLSQSQITNLDLPMNFLGDASAAALAKALAQSQVTGLNLGHNRIGDAGAAALAKVLAQSKVTNLALESNEIGAVGAAALAKVLAQSKVISINLSYNQIGPAGTAALAKVLVQSQVASLGLSSNDIGASGAAALASVLAQSQVTSLNLSSNKIGAEGAAALASALAQSKVTSLDLEFTDIGVDGAAALAKGLAQSQVTTLDLTWNNIGAEGAAALAKVLPQSQITSLNLRHNRIGKAGADALAHVLAQSQITSLDLSWNDIGAGGAAALAKVLLQSRVTNLDLLENDIGNTGAAALAKVLPKSQVTGLNLGHNRIGDAGAAALAKVLAQSKVTSLDLSQNNIGSDGATELLQAVKSSFTIQIIDLDELLDRNQNSILKNHLAFNKLLSSLLPEDKTANEFIQELESTALKHINQPSLLDDASLEKPKRLLLKAMELGSIQAIYLLGNLYLNELKNLTKAKEYYLKAASMGHAISKLCLEIIQETSARYELEMENLTIKLPRRFSLNTSNQKLALRDSTIASIAENNALVSKTGISLSAINELKSVKAFINVYVATKDYEPIDAGHLHFSKGQTIYINNFGGIEKNFASFIRAGLPNCFIPYNKDKQGIKRADVGFIPYGVFLSLQEKPRDDWSAEDVCNAIITPKTKPLAGEKAKPYVDMLSESERGKPFAGYILSYARSTKFTDILESLNERFKDRDSKEVFIWIDLACINQHAWMEMSSAAIGKILEVNLTQLFTHISEGRLIHFDKARPTNLTRSWCLVELLSCLKAQEETVAQTELCMSSNVQAEVLAQDLMGLLDTLDSSKAQCFNPQDKIAIDAQIKKSLTKDDETDITMDVAFARLNAVVKSWLVTKFLPDFSKVKEVGQEVHLMKTEPALVFSKPVPQKAAAEPKTNSKKRCVLM